MINPFTGVFVTIRFSVSVDLAKPITTHIKRYFRQNKRSLTITKFPSTFGVTHRDINISLGNVLANDFSIKTVLFKIIRQSKHGGKQKKNIS